MHRHPEPHKTFFLQDVMGQTQLVLWDPDFPAGVQKVLHIPPTLSHAEFGHSRGGHVDAAHRARADLIGQMTEHHSVHQRGAQIFREIHLQTALYAVSQMVCELQLLSQLLHLPPHRELRVD